MIALVAHDAGGAELVSSYARREGIAVMPVAEGPARVVFARKLPGISPVPFEEAMSACTSVLTGTSGFADLEIRAIAAARESGKFSASFLDHWINYGMRFERGRLSTLPDEIWVGDPFAEQLARSTWPALPVRVVPNPYFADLSEEFASLPPRPSSGPIDVLYVREPIRAYAETLGDRVRYGYEEEEALRYLLANLEALGVQVRGVRVRPHPSEDSAQYSWAQGDSPVPVELGGHATLAEEIAACDLVAGCESMALAVALVAGRRVVSCIPPGGNPCRLPLAGIEHLQSLVAMGHS